MSILPITNQSIANPWPIKCRSLVNSHNSMPIYNQFNRLPIRQFNANPLPILQRSANPSPIQKHNAHIGPIHQSITKSTIRSQSQTNLLNNPSPIHHSNANPPRHYQPINPMPTLRKTANPRPIHQSNANPWLSHQSSAGPLPIHQSQQIMNKSHSSMQALDQSITKTPNHCQYSTYPPVNL